MTLIVPVPRSLDIPLRVIWMDIFSYWKWLKEMSFSLFFFFLFFFELSIDMDNVTSALILMASFFFAH